MGVRQKLHRILSPLPGHNNRRHPSRDSRTSGCVCMSRMIGRISHENITCGDADLTRGIMGSTAPSNALAAGTGLCRSPSNGDRKPPCSCVGRCHAGGGRFAPTPSKPKRSSTFPRANKRPKDKRRWKRNSCICSCLRPSLQLQTELRGTKDAKHPRNPGDSVNRSLDDKRKRKNYQGTSDPSTTVPTPGKILRFPSVGSSILTSW